MTTETERGAIARVEQRLDDIFKLVGELREQLAYIRGRATHEAVEELREELAKANAKIAMLEAAHHQTLGLRTASKTWGEWTHRLAPWLFAVALVAWNYIKPPV